MRMTLRDLPRRAGRPISIAVAMLFVASTLSAHDFWIVPDAFQIAAGGTMSLHGQSSTKFPTSESGVAADRIAEARVVGATSDERITDFSVSDKSLLIRHRPMGAGQRVVALVLAARSSRTTPDRLKRYIALEGAPELAERYDRESAYPKTDGVTQVAGKFAKTMVEVGTGGPRAYAKAVGHALELVPVDDPSALRSGDTFGVRLLLHGRPLAGVVLRAGVAPPADRTPVSKDGSQGASTSVTKDMTAETGADGVARIAVTEPGLWNVRTLYAAPMQGTGGDWEVNFATLVFNVAGRRGTAGGEVLPLSVRSDSSDAVATVQRFHAALAAGDSAAALALLAPDVTILESGGVETLVDYRAHHLPADIEYARAVPSTPGAMHVTVQGGVAWVSSTSTTQGDFRGRAINSVGAELMVLARGAGGAWQIRAIHWSSRTRRPPQ